MSAEAQSTGGDAARRMFAGAVVFTPGQRRLFEEEQEATVALAVVEEEEMCLKAFLLGARTAFQSVGAEAIGESEDDRLLQALASLTR